MTGGNHKKQDQILYIGFNQKKSLVTVGTERGFHVYKSETMEEVGMREMGGGLGIVEVQNSSNYMVQTGGGRYPLFPLSKTIIWDDDEGHEKAELTFKSDVKAVKIKVEFLIVLIETKIFVYNTLGSQELIYQAPTLINQKGVFSVNASDAKTLVAFPSELKDKKELGLVTIKDLNDTNPDDPDHKDNILVIKCHNSALSSLEFNYNGKLLATCSEKGTLIRIHDTKTAEMIQELRRGHEYVIIFSLCFDFEDNWQACTSDSGTIHIFNINSSKVGSSNVGKDEQDLKPKNPKSKLRFLGFMSNYFKNEFSFAHFQVDFENKTKIGFLQDGSVLLLSYLGDVIKLGFDPINGGTCTKQVFKRNFLLNES